MAPRRPTEGVLANYPGSWKKTMDWNDDEPGRSMMTWLFAPLKTIGGVFVFFGMFIGAGVGISICCVLLVLVIVGIYELCRILFSL
jgi:hypothetical protein